MRELSEIQAAERQFVDKLHYVETQAYIHQIMYHGEPTPPEDEYDAMVAGCTRLEAKYGIDNLKTEDDFEDGVIAGKLAALRYVLGWDWDDEGLLDT